MDSGLWAEWIIARFSDRSRAGSIVGDLLETETVQQPMRFWMSVGRILFSLAWRGMIAYAVAYCVALFLARRVIGPNFGIHPIYSLPENSELLLIVRWLGCVSWIGATYSAVRFGLRDKFAQLTLGFCGLITVATLCWWLPFVPLACVALAFSIVVGSVRSGQRSKALAALAFALAIGFEGSRIALYLDPTVRGHFYYPMTYYVEILFRFLTVWTMTASCACMHHVMLSRDHRGMEIQSPT